MELRYGVYQLTVIADGFETWERQLVIHSKEATIQIGEPQLSQEDILSEDQDTQETDPENGDGQDTAGSGSSTSADDTQPAETNGEEAGTSPEAVENSSTGDYSDYLDTITDLITSLVKLKNE